MIHYIISLQFDRFFICKPLFLGILLLARSKLCFLDCFTLLLIHKFINLDFRLVEFPLLLYLDMI